MKILFLSDPLENFNIQKDSTYVLMQACFKRGFKIFSAGIEDLWAEGPEAGVCGKSLSLREGLDWFELGEAQKINLKDFKIIFMRKDPPFNMKYIYATYLLELAEKTGVKIINSPRALRDANEKCFILQFPEVITRTLVSANQAELKDFLAQEKTAIFKPLDGMGGASIFKVSEGDPNLAVILELLTQEGSLPIMAQRYLPEIKNGDKRILLINGKPISHGLSRIPKMGETRGNLAAGGRGEVNELTHREYEICEKIGPRLKQMGLVFVGLDVIGDFVTEINVTSPTCVQEIEKYLHQDIAGKILDAAIGA